MRRDWKQKAARQRVFSRLPGGHWLSDAPSISAYNFLTFDEAAGRRYRPSLHFRNRLGHQDHAALIESAGFEILASEVEAGSPDDLDTLDTLAALDRAPQYRDVDPEALAIRTSRLTLRAVR